MTGIDIGRYPIDLARTRVADDKIDAEFLCADILRIEYKNEFDLVFLICGQMGHFSPEECRVIFARTAASLKDGGVFIIHLPTFSREDMASYTQWYQEKQPFYFDHPAIIHREQYFFENEQVKLIRDFAVDTVTRHNTLFGVSEKAYTQSELESYASEQGLILTEVFGDYKKSPREINSSEKIYVFRKKDSPADDNY
nr:class I SAM-dependent methyltransferase [candidate division Zixibacteria bacterium]